MKVISYIKKIILLIKYKSVYRGNFIYPNWYLFNIKIDKLARVKKVLFMLNDNEYMHLGDHIFFIPLIQKFIDNGYDVDISVISIMVDLCTQLKLHVINDVDNIAYSDYDLIISRTELISKLRQYPALLINISKNLTKPIWQQLINNFNQYFIFNNNQISLPNFNSIIDNTIIDKFNLPADKDLIFFNPYCNSSNYLINNNKLTKLANKLLGLISANCDFEKNINANGNTDIGINTYSNVNDNITIKNNYQIILTGSAHDKINDNNQYYIDKELYQANEFYQMLNMIDLRGKTNVIDIFNLVAYNKTLYYVGFDAFIMHVFSIYHKKSFVVFRGRITKMQTIMLSKYHVNLSYQLQHYVKLLA